MTESEAIEMLNTFQKEDEMYDAAQIAINALEKQIPKFHKEEHIRRRVNGGL